MIAAASGGLVCEAVVCTVDGGRGDSDTSIPHSSGSAL